MTFWNKKWGKESLCCITLSRLRPGYYKNSYKKCTFLKCGHGFYTRALIEWIKNDSNKIPKCPMCRQEIDIYDLTKTNF
jgi:hypothetical protein